MCLNGDGMSSMTLISSKAVLLDAMPTVKSYLNTFESINKRWDGAITAGLIEAGRMEQEAAHVFSPLIEDMGATKGKFEHLQQRLVEAIVSEMLKKVVSELTDAAKFAINILKRNLFERTADVGYLAMDWELCDFLRMHVCEGESVTPEEYRERKEFVQNRLQQYVYEYTVYDEIIILDLQGRVVANLDESTGITLTKDPLLEETLKAGRPGAASDEPYVETFRATDLRPGKGNTLVYSQTMRHPETKEELGILCLCFDFADEMQRIFDDLEEGGSFIVSILDKAGRVIASNNTSALPLGEKLAAQVDESSSFIKFRGADYIATTVSTDGYQGFYGLEWYGQAMMPVQSAFGTQAQADAAHTGQFKNISTELDQIKQEADDILADMKLDSINGQVKAARHQADGFVEVLRFVNMVADEIDGVFSSSIQNLQKTIVSSLQRDIGFRAFQGNNIADRNLYERANDVCWWALTPMFRKVLARHCGGSATSEDLSALRDNLQYINDLYTPYLRLLLGSAQGDVLAVSNPPEGLEERLAQEAPKGQELVGRQLEPAFFRRAMGLQSHRDYCVSDFAATELYGHRPTYVYSTAVRHMEDDAPAGVIQIVFDGEPQFKAMLEDILPRNGDGTPKEGAFGVFCDRQRTILSSTSGDYPVGGRLPLDESIFRLPRGERMADAVRLGTETYLVGGHASEGYREYKRQDGYENDVLCLVFLPV